jgi:putative transposase
MPQPHRLEYLTCRCNIYLNCYEFVPELQAGLKAYFPFYNEVRPHQSLDYRTPAVAYRQGRRVAR